MYFIQYHIRYIHYFFVAVLVVLYPSGLVWCVQLGVACRGVNSGQFEILPPPLHKPDVLRPGIVQGCGGLWSCDYGHASYQCTLPPPPDTGDEYSSALLARPVPEKVPIKGNGVIVIQITWYPRYWYFERSDANRVVSYVLVFRAR